MLTLELSNNINSEKRRKTIIIFCNISLVTEVYQKGHSNHVKYAGCTECVFPLENAIIFLLSSKLSDSMVINH
jgi:hypothetical protein